MTAATKVQCPSCNKIVDEADLVATETPEDFEEMDTSEWDRECLPERYHDTHPIRCHVRRVHIVTECRDCHDRHVN